MTIVIALAIGLVVGLATGGLGGGGSVLTVPALVFLLGEAPHTASTASLVIVGISSVFGLGARLRSGNVQWRSGIVFGVLGAGTAVLGTQLSRRLDPNVLLLAFAALVLVAAYLLVRKSPTPAASPPLPSPASPDRAGDKSYELDGAGSASGEGDPGGGVAPLEAGGTRVAVAGAAAPSPVAAPPGPAGPTGPGRVTLAYALKVAVLGAVVGFSTGLFGVGGGFLVVPALVVVLGWSMPVAVATSLLVIMLNSLSSLGARVATEAFDWRLIAIVTLAAVVGTLLGKLVADRASSVGLARSFAGLLVLVAGYTAVTSIIALG